MSFILNAFIIRHISHEMFAVMTVRLHLLYGTGLLLSREAFRRAAFSSKGSGHIFKLINLIWIGWVIMCSFSNVSLNTLRLKKKVWNAECRKNFRSVILEIIDNAMLLRKCSEFTHYLSHILLEEIRQLFVSTNIWKINIYSIYVHRILHSSAVT